MLFKKNIENQNLSELTKDPLSKKYSGYSFRYKNELILFRIAKITSIKTGGFVTIYTKSNKGNILPFGFELVVLN